MSRNLRCLFWPFITKNKVIFNFPNTPNRIDFYSRLVKKVGTGEGKRHATE